MLDALTTLLEAGAAAPWVPAVMLLVALGDALFPPMPSEGVLVALAAVAVAGDGPHLPLLALAAGVGAFLGDGLTFLVGRRFGPQRLHRVTSPRARRLLGGASGTLERRGALVVLTARYVPLGRVAVNLTAGRHRLPTASLRRPRRAGRRDVGRLVGGRRRAGRALARTATRCSGPAPASRSPSAWGSPSTGSPAGSPAGAGCRGPRHPPSTTRATRAARWPARWSARSSARSPSPRADDAVTRCPRGALPFALSPRECQ